MENGLRIGEVAARAGVNVQTLRFYERRGLLQEPPRRPSGYREYPPESVRLIRFVKRAQQLGFSLDEVHELLQLRMGRRAACADVKHAAEEKLDAVPLQRCRARCCDESPQDRTRERLSAPASL